MRFWHFDIIFVIIKLISSPNSHSIIVELFKCGYSIYEYFFMSFYFYIFSFL